MPPHDASHPTRPHRKTKRQPSTSPSQEGSFFLRLTDWGLLAALLLVPFLMGGRQAAGQLALVCCATWVALAWALHQFSCQQPTWKFTRAEPLLLAGVGLALLQITHLPADILQKLSPRIAEILPIWNATDAAASSTASWSQISLYPAATQSALVTLVAYGLIFLVVAQRIQKVDDAERVLRWVGLTVAAMAAFGLVQYLAGNGKFFWVYSHPFVTTEGMPKGSFTNRNHFAQFLALGAAPLIWWIISMMNSGQQSRKGGFERPAAREGGREFVLGLLLLALGTVVFTQLLSLSRGGTLSMFAAALVCLGITGLKGYVSKKLLAGLCLIGVLAGSSLMIFGLDDVSNRMENWESGRTEIWKTNLQMFGDFPVLGTGIGTHAQSYKLYLDQPYNQREWTHAESSVLQIASETGVVGLGLAALVVLTCLYWCLRGLRATQSRRVTVALAAVLGSLVASLTHSFFDMVWFVPGCMVLVIVMAACACRLYQLSRDETRVSAGEAVPFSGMQLPRPVWAFSLLCVAALGGWMVLHRLPELIAEGHWHHYLRMSLATNADASQDMEQTGEERFLKQMATLQSAARATPNNARLRYLMSAGFLQLFGMRQQKSDNPMTISQIRDAALVSKFDSLDAQNQWVDVVVGENRKHLNAALRHARKSLELCPLQGRAYLNLAELSFLVTRDAEKPSEYIDQALTVRPHDPRVIFVAGREAWTNGDFEQGIVHWKRAFHRSRAHQLFIIRALAPNVPAQFFIDTFDPDWQALEHLTQHFKTLQKPDDYDLLVRRFAETSVERAREMEGPEAVEAWLHAQRSYDAIGDQQRVMVCLENALRSDPTSFDAHYSAGKWFYQHEQFTEAAEHFVWCSRRRPRDEQLQTLTEAATRMRLQTPSNIRTVSGQSEIAPPGRN